MTKERITEKQVREEYKDRVYRLKQGSPLSCEIASRNTVRSPLYYHDPVTKKNRALRYAVNFDSVFEDEQEGEAITPGINFEKGMLMVFKENLPLQVLLSCYHPGIGIVYTEVNAEEDAEREMKELNMQADAISAARKLTIEQAEHMYRVLLNRDPANVQSAIIIRDVMLKAKNEPGLFLEKLEDPTLTVQNDVHLLFDRNLLGFRNNNTAVHYNLKDNKTRLLQIPEGSDPYQVCQEYFQTVEGVETMKILNKAYEEL